MLLFFFFSSRRRHTRCGRDWSSDVCSSDLTAARVVTGFDSPRQSPDIRRQVREEAADLREGFIFAFDFIVDCAAAASVNARPAQFFFRDLLAYATLDHRRARDEELADSSNHHRKMRMHDAHRAESRAGA